MSPDFLETIRKATEEYDAWPESKKAEMRTAMALINAEVKREAELREQRKDG